MPNCCRQHFNISRYLEGVKHHHITPHNIRYYLGHNMVFISCDYIDMKIFESCQKPTQNYKSSHI